MSVSTFGIDRLCLTLAVVPFAILISGCAHSPPPNQRSFVPKQHLDAPVKSRRTSSVPNDSHVDNADLRDSPEAGLDDEQERDTEYDDSTPEPLLKPHPLAAYSDAELKTLYEKHPALVGSVSVGRPNAGRLINGVRPKESPVYHLEDPSHAWGTSETVDALTHVLEVVALTHPGTPCVAIGHLSAREGGHLNPHHSHQSGRDVDLGLYYAQLGTRWYTKATEQSLDAARTWTLIRTLATDTDIEMVLLDRRLQEPIERYAESIERDTAWVHLLFHGGQGKPALVRHSPGHATHVHLRFRNPIAQETARRLVPYLRTEHQALAREAPAVKVHVASTGDTLAKLAQRYHTTMEAIRKANHMRTFQLVAGQRYLIPAETSTEVPKR